MKGFRQAALAAALVTGAGLAPASAGHAQNRTAVLRAFELGRGTRIGASVRDVEDADRKDSKQPTAGVIIDSVEPDGPADKAGVKAGDAITEFDGERVRSVRQFSRLVQETPSGRTVAVGVSRGGQHLSLNVTTNSASLNDDYALRLLDLPPAPPMPAEAPRPPRAPTPPALAPAPPFDTFSLVSGRRLGMSLETLDDQLAQFFGVKEGVLVRSVEKDSAAQQAGLRAGDVITAVNGRQVYDPSDVTRAIARTGDSGEFTVDVVRDHKPQTLKGKLEARTRGRGAVTMF